MCEVMGIRLEDSCEGIIGFINAQEKEKREFWRRIEAAAQDGTVLEKRSEDRKDFATQIVDERPEIVSRSAYENNREYRVFNRPCAWRRSGLQGRYRGRSKGGSR